MTKLILIRHGQTDYNLQNKYCGFSDPPLNKVGIQQSESLINKLKAFKINKIYSSDLKRAYQTAEIIFKNKPIEKTADFREINLGIFEGLNFEEIMEKYPKIYCLWIKDPENIKIPDGEGLKCFNKRVQAKLFSVLSKHLGKTIAVITHGGPIKVILCHIMRQELKNSWDIEQGNCSLNIIDYTDKTNAKIIKLNDISHMSYKENLLCKN